MCLAVRAMDQLQSSAVDRSSNKTQLRRRSVLQIFCDPVSNEYAPLRNLSCEEWQRLLRWLDTSGLALYFLDRVAELEIYGIVPPAVLSRLQQNLADNTARIAAMICESTAIHRGFQEAGLLYATVKGFSLWPASVPKLELRSQLDLDFLMSESSAPEARKILESRGYYLHAVCRGSWEFKSNQNGISFLKDMYKVKPRLPVELHLEAVGEGTDSLLARSEVRYFHGVDMPVLSPVDLFLGQGLHIFKHICSAHSRTAHLIEFRRHVCARYHDDTFWRQLEQLAERNSSAPIALGMAVLLISHVMDDFAPEALTRWTVARLPPAVRMWVELYGVRTVFCDPPGSKLYLLLQKALVPEGIPAKRSARRVLLPLRLPRAIAHGTVDETMPARITRYRRQLNFIWFRMRFHVVEGLRYMRESARWRKQIKRIGG
jgi:hypothetical protein